MQRSGGVLRMDLHSISKLSKDRITVLPGQPKPTQCQAIQLHLELSEAKTIAAPGKSVTTYLIKTFAYTQLFPPPKAVL